MIRDNDKEFWLDDRGIEFFEKLINICGNIYLLLIIKV